MIVGSLVIRNKSYLCFCTTCNVKFCFENVRVAHFSQVAELQIQDTCSCLSSFSNREYRGCMYCICESVACCTYSCFSQVGLGGGGTCALCLVTDGQIISSYVQKIVLFLMQITTLIYIDYNKLTNCFSCRFSVQIVPCLTHITNPSRVIIKLEVKPIY